MGSGFGDQTLKEEEIERYETTGLTAEWDSCAICVALLCLSDCHVDAEWVLPQQPPIPARPVHGLPFPGIQGVLRTVQWAHGGREHPLEAAKHALQKQRVGSDPAAAQAAMSILGDAREAA